MSGGPLDEIAAWRKTEIVRSAHLRLLLLLLLLLLWVVVVAVLMMPSHCRRGAADVCQGRQSHIGKVLDYYFNSLCLAPLVSLFLSLCVSPTHRAAPLTADRSEYGPTDRSGHRHV